MPYAITYEYGPSRVYAWTRIEPGVVLGAVAPTYEEARTLLHTALAQLRAPDDAPTPCTTRGVAMKGSV